MEPRLVLASASPRRRQILQALGVAFRGAVADVDESPHPGEAPGHLVSRLARSKAAAVALGEALPVLAADTVVVLDGQILGKPRSESHAREMLQGLQGRTHEVFTGVCLVSAGVEYAALDTTRVTFAPMTEAEIAWYVATGEPMGKAGGYHVDGRAALFVLSIAGSPSSVAGLPARLVLDLSRDAGLSLGVA